LLLLRVLRLLLMLVLLSVQLARGFLQEIHDSDGGWGQLREGVGSKLR
jgi:hypothetical protein